MATKEPITLEAIDKHILDLEKARNIDKTDTDKRLETFGKYILDLAKAQNTNRNDTDKKLDNLNEKVEKKPSEDCICTGFIAIALSLIGVFLIIFAIASGMQNRYIASENRETAVVINDKLMRNIEKLIDAKVDTAKENVVVGVKGLALMIILIICGMLIMYFLRKIY